MTDHDAPDVLDPAIDEIARELTDGQPSRGFSARVRERIERPARATGWTWQTAAALALVAVMVYVSWPGPTDRSAEAPVVATRSAPSGSSPASRPPAVEPREATPREANAGVPQRIGPTRPLPRRAVPRIPIDVDAPQIAALGEVNELTVSVAPPRDLDLPGLSVRDVTIPPLDTGDKERR